MNSKYKFSFFSISFKLYLIMLFFVFPIGIMLYIYISSKNEIINVTKLEIKGNKFQISLEKLLIEVILHKINTLNKNNFNSFLISNNKILQEIKNIKIVNEELGKDLQFTEIGLSQRNRKEYTVKNLEKKIITNIIHPIKMNRYPDLIYYNNIIKHIMVMIRHIGDTSSLILDSDLDSYYLMDITLIKIPQMQVDIQKILEIVNTKKTKKLFFSNEDETINQLISKFINIDIPKIKDSLNTSIQENPNIYFISKTLKPSMENGSKILEENLNIFINSILINSSEELKLKQINRDGINSINYLFQFQKVAIIELDILLNNRMDWELKNIRNSVILSLGVVLLSFFFSYLIIADIIDKIDKIKKVTYMILDGDLTQRISLKSRDELGSLAKSFDKMVSKVDILLQLQEILVEAGDRLGKLKTRNESVIEFSRILNKVLLFKENTSIKFYINLKNEKESFIEEFTLFIHNSDIEIKQITNLTLSTFNHELNGVITNKFSFIKNEKIYI